MGIAEGMTLERARCWMQRFERTVDSLYRDPEPCEHGHFGCSTVERGACMNEVTMKFYPEFE